MTQHIFNTMATNREHNFMPHAEVAVFVREDLTFRRFVNFEGRYLSSFCYVVTRTFVSEPTYACTGPTVVLQKIRFSHEGMKANVQVCTIHHFVII